MDATLWRMSARPSTDDIDPETGEVMGSSPATDRELLNMDIKLVGTAPNGDEIVHIAPGIEAPSPPDFTTILNPGWTWDDVPGPIRDGVLEAAYETTDEDGNTVRRRAKITDVPDGAVVVATDQPPHRWYGDGEP